MEAPQVVVTDLLATVSKIHFSKLINKYSLDNSDGMTLLEVILATTITIVLFTVIWILVNPTVMLKRGRDEKRLSDLSMLDRVITEYKLDQGSYPDTVNTLRTSTTLPVGSTSLTSVKAGWIACNLSTYTSRFPIDPINDSTYYYSYFHTSDGYELDAKLEYNTSLMSSDGGNDPNSYEVGNNLNLISP